MHWDGKIQWHERVLVCLYVLKHTKFIYEYKYIIFSPNNIYNFAEIALIDFIMMLYEFGISTSILFVEREYKSSRSTLSDVYAKLRKNF